MKGNENTDVFEIPHTVGDIIRQASKNVSGCSFSPLIDVDTSIQEVASVFIQRKVDCLPVGENGKIVGCIKMMDIIHLVAKWGVHSVEIGKDIDEEVGKDIEIDVNIGADVDVDESTKVDEEINVEEEVTGEIINIHEVESVDLSEEFDGGGRYWLA